MDRFDLKKRIADFEISRNKLWYTQGVKVEAENISCSEDLCVADVVIKGNASDVVPKILE